MPPPIFRKEPLPEAEIKRARALDHRRGPAVGAGVHLRRGIATRRPEAPPGGAAAGSGGSQSDRPPGGAVLCRPTRSPRPSRSTTRCSCAAFRSTSSACRRPRRSWRHCSPRTLPTSARRRSPPARAECRLRRPLADLLERPAAQRLRRHRLHHRRTQADHRLAVWRALHEPALRPVRAPARRPGQGARKVSSTASSGAAR
jgi:hypothetical protein